MENQQFRGQDILVISILCLLCVSFYMAPLRAVFKTNDKEVLFRRAEILSYQIAQIYQDRVLNGLPKKRADSLNFHLSNHEQRKSGGRFIASINEEKPDAIFAGDETSVNLTGVIGQNENGSSFVYEILGVENNSIKIKIKTLGKRPESSQEKSAITADTAGLNAAKNINDLSSAEESFTYEFSIPIVLPTNG